MSNRDVWPSVRLVVTRRRRFGSQREFAIAVNRFTAERRC
jgi:hypothetical protein